MPEPLCQILEWDSKFFGARIARIEERHLSAEKTGQVFQWCQENKIDCLYFLCAPADDDSVLMAEKSGFHLVDIRMELSCQVPDQPKDMDLFVRHHRDFDLSELQEIAADAYTDSRFYFDRSFSREQASALYREWIVKSCHGDADAVLIVPHQETVGGFITCHLEPPNMGRIGLIGVNSNARSVGLGGALVGASLNYFCDQGVKEVRVVTQGRNIAAQRLYQSAGFRTQSMYLWYHKWFELDK